MFKTKNKIIQLLALAIVLPFLGLGCKGAGTIAEESLAPVTLNYWRVFDEPSDFTDIITAFKQLHPNININVRKLRFEEYEDAIIRALAEGNGPDIISVQTTQLKQYQNLLSPIPPSITLPVAFYDGKKMSISLQTKKLPDIRDIRNNFVDTVASDITINGQIYALPLGIDTLVLYYNRAMLNQANIPFAPATWAEFKEQIKELTIQDKEGNIIQSGVPLGGAYNINRAPDILALLMMQNGTPMADANNSRATFNLVPENLTNPDIAPGADALRFYTDFASPAKEVYTWNESMSESLNAFTGQKSAFFIGYSYHLPLIRSLAPGMDLEIAPLPQISSASQQVNFANYWVEGVTRQSKNQNEAWAFVDFAASAPNVSSFLVSAQKPTALRSLIANQKQDPAMSVFANQVLTAKTWYHGRNSSAMEEAMRAAIQQVVDGEREPQEAIDEAVGIINLTY